MEEQRKVILASHMGFCRGVKGALARFDACRKKLPPGEPLYVLHELVHNSEVTRQMAARGARFIDDPRQLPQGAAVLVGAHGATAAEETAVAARTSRCMDATCPVIRSLRAAIENMTEHDTLVCFGDGRHQELRGLASRARVPYIIEVSGLDTLDSALEARNPALLCQTSLFYREADAAIRRFTRRHPGAPCLGGTCGASRARQKAAEKLAAECDAVVVVGSPHSANASQLCAIVRNCGRLAALVETPTAIPPEILSCRRIGLTAGASTPPEQIRRIAEALQGQ